jgi:hypothetical protein
VANQADEQMLKELNELGHSGMGERSALWAVGEIARLRAQIADMRKQHSEDIRDLQRETREVASEVRWQERLGEDYGSY